MNADPRRGRRAPLLLLTVAASVLIACSPCGDERVHDLAAPGGSLIASTFVRNCGATTDYATWVTLHSKSGTFNRPDDLVFTAKGDHGIELNWKDAHHLLIECRNCEE